MQGTRECTFTGNKISVRRWKENRSDMHAYLMRRLGLEEFIREFKVTYVWIMNWWDRK